MFLAATPPASPICSIYGLALSRALANCCTLPKPDSKAKVPNPLKPSANIIPLLVILLYELTKLRYCSISILPKANAASPPKPKLLTKVLFNVLETFSEAADAAPPNPLIASDPRLIIDSVASRVSINGSRP